MIATVKVGDDPFKARGIGFDAISKVIFKEEFLFAAVQEEFLDILRELIERGTEIKFVMFGDTLQLVPVIVFSPSGPGGKGPFAERNIALFPGRCIPGRPHWGY